MELKAYHDKVCIDPILDYRGLPRLKRKLIDRGRQKGNLERCFAVVLGTFKEANDMLEQYK